MRLFNVNGDLMIFSESKGFKNYIKAKADALLITEIIQRYYHNDIVMHFKGKQQSIFRTYDDFRIVTDYTRTKDKGGIVIRGRYSDVEHDRMTVTSQTMNFCVVVKEIFNRKLINVAFWHYFVN